MNPSPFNRQEILWMVVLAPATILALWMGYYKTAGLFGYGLLLCFILPWMLVNDPLNREKVVFDDRGIKVKKGLGKSQKIAWRDLHEVTIVTTAEGPMFEDVHWYFVSGNPAHWCVVGGSTNGFDRLFERLQELPNFDNEAVISAMARTGNDRFLVWKKEA